MKHSDKIVVFGMSCVGKTTFAKQLKDHVYYCFDALFQWHLIETLGLSSSENLQHIKKSCVADKFILDGWHLSDASGKFFPDDVCVYVLYSEYDRIIDQYRVSVTDKNEHKNMFKKWYHEIEYSAFPQVRYFYSDEVFEETSREKFATFLIRNQ